MTQSLLESNGAQGGGENIVPISSYVFLTGLHTNRNPLGSGLNVITSGFYKIGAIETLLGGINCEISPRNTVCRRPGNTAGLAGILSSANLPDIANSFYSFHELNDQVRVIVDGQLAPYLLTSSAVIPIFSKLSATITNSAVTASVATITAANSFAQGQTVIIVGSTNGGGVLNGTWTVTSATSTQFQFTFTSSTLGTASDTGFATASGQSFYQGVAQTLYFSDAQESQKWQDFGVGQPGNSLSTITASVFLGTVATVTALNSFVPGQTVVISGSTNGGGELNGAWVVTAANSQQFQFAFSGSTFSSAPDTGFASGCWNLGIVPPTTAPTINVVSAGSSAILWTANTTFTTMGLLTDSNGNVQQLTSVNADGSNSVGATIGTSSNGHPTFSLTPGGTTTDNTVTWTNYGPIVPWAPKKTYNNASIGGTAANPCIIYDPQSNSCYIIANAGGAQGTSGAQKPAFTGGLGSIFFDGTAKWFCLGSPNTPPLWAPSHTYATLGTVTNNDGNSGISTPTTPQAAGIGTSSTPQTVYWQAATTGGTSSSSNTAPAWATTVGTLTNDGQLSWQCLGSATRISNQNYTAWTANNKVFGVIKDGNGNFQVCLISGKTAVSAPTFQTSYGAQTVDGTVTWTCVGASLSWAAATKWFLPSGGFVPPPTGTSYGGGVVTDANANLQFTINNGMSANAHPTWGTVSGAITADNGAGSSGSLQWIFGGTPPANSVSWTVSKSWCYSLKSRSTSDAYAPSITTFGIALPGGGLNPPGSGIQGNPAWSVGNSAGRTPTGSADGSVSSASPTVTTTGANAGAVVMLSGFGSTDPQVDTISIFRTQDGGATYYWATDIAAPAPINGVAQPWTFADFLPDNANSTFPGLNTSVLAPLGNFNNPPPTGLSNLTYHLSRVFGSVGNTLYCSNGPLVGGSTQPPGNGYTAFNLSQFWSFNAPVKKLIPTSAGLIVFTTSGTHMLVGGPDITTVNAIPYLPDFGVGNYNAVTQRGGSILAYSIDGQVISVSPEQGVTHLGFPIADQLYSNQGVTSTFTPSSSYAAYLSEGLDDALFIADGKTGWFRCILNPSPNSSITGAIWSPKANVTFSSSLTGAGAVGAVEVKSGQKALLIASTQANQPVLVRDSNYNTFTDNGNPYPANFIFGSIVMANPGQIAEVDSIICDFNKVGGCPGVGVLMNETSGTFESLSGYVSSVTGNPPMDPPSLFGLITQPNTLYSPRYYAIQANPNDINGTPIAPWCRHLQIQVDFGAAEIAQNELLSLTILGAHWKEKSSRG